MGRRLNSYLRRYLHLLERYCPDTLHVWMPRFDGRQTSSATYDLVSGTALNLSSGAAFSGDGKRIVLDKDEAAYTDAITTRPYVYFGLVVKIGDPTKNTGLSSFYPGSSGRHALLAYRGTSTPYFFYSHPAVGGSYDATIVPRAYFSALSSFVVVEFVYNTNESICRSPQEDSHLDYDGRTLDAPATFMRKLYTSADGSSNEFAAFIYGGATTSAPLESLASVVKRGESGSLLAEMFRELI